ncbi:hypothetical protein QAD02_003624 [Eretmocerus hayati]|uniref:Uncharacterized protein n=1 Tax=Eretmocerus hayati TaxID=131215 RepID=A0ACC2NMF7_9HYME|nr:hypothetical protein QAD02_003624 [Eretmocerus hayati]
MKKSYKGGCSVCLNYKEDWKSRNEDAPDDSETLGQVVVEIGVLDQNLDGTEETCSQNVSPPPLGQPRYVQKEGGYTTLNSTMRVTHRETLGINCQSDFRGGKVLQDFLCSEYFDLNMCWECNEPGTQVTRIPGSYLALDFEMSHLKISLNVLPVELVVLGTTYILVGLIAKEITNMDGTYASNTRLMNGSWYKQRAKKQSRRKGKEAK